MTVKYSIVIPIYHDGYLASRICSLIEDAMLPYAQGEALHHVLEIIFVNDGSSDDSLLSLLDVQKQCTFVRILDLSRNFGQHAAIACGLREARGSFVIRMNVDGQDPPSEIPKLLSVADQENADLVVGRYQKRESPFVDRVTAYIYFGLFRSLTGFKTVQNTSPLRVMSRRFVDAYNVLTEHDRFPQGLDHWLGFNHRYVEISHQPRPDKRSSYTFQRRLMLAVNGILYFSDRPMKIIVSMGFLCASFGLLFALVLIFQKLIGMEIVPGFTFLGSIALVAFGVQLFVMGLLGLYIGKIFQEVQNRPLYIVRERYDARDSAQVHKEYR